MRFLKWTKSLGSQGCCQLKYASPSRYIGKNTDCQSTRELQFHLPNHRVVSKWAIRSSTEWAFAKERICLLKIRLWRMAWLPVFRCWNTAEQILFPVPASQFFPTTELTRVTDWWTLWAADGINLFGLGLVVFLSFFLQVFLQISKLSCRFLYFMGFTEKLIFRTALMLIKS